MTPRQQLAAIKRDRERALKQAQRDRLRELRERLKRAKVRRRERKIQVANVCREAVRAQDEKAKRLRAELRELTQARKKRGGTCSTARRQAVERGTAEVAAAAAELAEAKRQRRVEAIWLGEPSLARATGLSSRERRQESDDEVERDIPGELVPVWHRVKHRIQGNARKSRTEAFVHWASEHRAQVSEILNEQLERDVKRLEREYRELHKQKKPRLSHLMSASAALDDVPF